ncbi:MAG: hypothetical protein FJZ60_00185 [Chlamydiae bacterium]|nr:hypothetical protein [Chlamydiota bacterium]
MKKLQKEDVIKIMREEWNAKIAILREEVDLTFKAKVDGEEKTLPNQGLKLRGKENKILYTITKVAVGGVGLRPPEGPADGSKDFFVDKEVLEDKYELD